jgi:hypothetical protein
MRFQTQMKRNNGHVSHGRRVMDYVAAAMQQMELYCTAHPGSPSAVRHPQLLVRGELWIALLGPSVEEGIVGIGPTVAAALGAFDARYLAGLRPAVEPVSKVGLPHQPAKALGTARRPYHNPKADPKSPQKFHVLPGRRSGLFAPYEHFGSSIRVETCERELPKDLPNRPHIVVRTTSTGKYS